MKVLFDTNVILDVLLDRKPFAEDASKLFSQVDIGALKGYMCATSATTVYYFVRKSRGAHNANEIIKQWISILEIAPVTRRVLELAIATPISDFEDAVIVASALLIGADAIVTRDAGGFGEATLSVYSPPDLLAFLNNLHGEFL